MMKRLLATMIFACGSGAVPFGIHEPIYAQDSVLGPKLAIEIPSDVSPPQGDNFGVLTVHGPVITDGSIATSLPLLSQEMPQLQIDPCDGHCIFLNAGNLLPSRPHYYFGAFNLANPGGEVVSWDGITLGAAKTAINLTLVGHTVHAGAEVSSPALSTQFVNLSEKLATLKLKRLQPESLAGEIERLKREISDLEAAEKLEEAQEQLKRILNDHPTSPAALNAKRMLEGGLNEGIVPARLTPVEELPTAVEE